MASKRAKKKAAARRRQQIGNGLGAAAAMAAPVVLGQVVQSVADKIGDLRAQRDADDRVRELRIAHSQVMDELAAARPWQRRALRKEGTAIRQAIAAYRAGAETAAEFYARSVR